MKGVFGYSVAVEAGQKVKIRLKAYSRNATATSSQVG